MKTRQGYVQGYNAQAVVTEDQVIVAAEVTQEANDVKQLHPMLEQTEANLAAVELEDEVEAVLADAGYWSETNIERADPEGPELFIATTKDWKQRKAMRERPSPRGRTPKNLGVRVATRPVLSPDQWERAASRKGLGDRFRDGEELAQFTTNRRLKKYNAAVVICQVPFSKAYGHILREGDSPRRIHCVHSRVRPIFWDLAGARPRTCGGQQDMT